MSEANLDAIAEAYHSEADWTDMTMIEKPTMDEQPKSVTLGTDSAIGTRRPSRYLVSLIIVRSY